MNHRVEWIVRYGLWQVISDRIFVPDLMSRRAYAATVRMMLAERLLIPVARGFILAPDLMKLATRRGEASVQLQVQSILSKRRSKP